MVNRNRPELFDRFDFNQFARLATRKVLEATFLGIPIRLGNNSYLVGFIVAMAVGIILNVMPCVLPIVPLKAMSFYEAGGTQPCAKHDAGRTLQCRRGRYLCSAGGGSDGLSAVRLGSAIQQPLVCRCNQPDSTDLFPPDVRAFQRAAPLRHLQLGAFPADTGRQLCHGNVYGHRLNTMHVRDVGDAAGMGGEPAGLDRRAAGDVRGGGDGTPLLPPDAFPQVARRVPRSGAWAETVKQMLGFLVLASAVFFASPFVVRLVGDRGFWWLLFAVVAAAGVFLVIRTLVVAKTSRAVIISVVIALTMILPANWAAIRLTRHLIDWQPFSQEMLDQSQKDDKIVIVKFTAAWVRQLQGG